MGDSSKADGANAIALGNAAKAAGIMSIGLGDNANASQDYTMALGAESEAAENATAIGNKAHAKGVNSIALGNGSQALADSAIAIGQGNKANGADAIALGNGSQSSGLNAIALGKASVVTGDNSLALGSNTNANGINSVALGAGSIADQDDSVSVGSDSLQRKIVNVKNGTIKADSHDAINGSQLYAISDSVAKRLGGGSSVNVDDGTVKAPTYNLKNGNKNNVGDALTVLDQFTLQWDQNRDKYSAAHGSSTASVITDVADGAVSDSSKDAVNGSQLKATNDDVETNTTNIATNTGNIATNTANIATNTTNITNLTDTVGDLKDDALLWNGTAFNAAHGTETTSTITNVKAGTLSDDSTDAVNGSQLKATNDNVATNTTNIASNTANIATNTANINTLNTSIDTLEQDAILWNGTAYSAAHGTETASTITNVKAGTLSENSTDAVNGAQLNATNANVATNTTNIATNTASINTLNTSIDALEQDALLWDGTAFSAAHGANKDASKITNVLAGTVSSASTDAINGSQLHGLSSSIATYLGGGATVSDSGVFSGPTYNIDGNDYTNVGAALDAINTSLSDSLGDALLWDSTTGAFSAKHGSTASVITNVADGAVSDSSSDAVNGSQLYDVSNSVVDVLGGGAGVNTDGSISAPTYTIANTDYDNVGDALNALDTTLDDAMLWDATAGENGAFSASHDGSASKITNVAAGTISDTSTDAVNGAQLHGVSSSVAEALGGGAAVNSDGSISAPTYTIADTDYTNVGDAMNAIDSTLDNALLWDAAAGENGAFNASHDGKASVITNVANGQINETSTDAVNGSQLNATNMLIQNIAGDTSESYITENGEGINYVRTNDSGLVFEDASATG
ncbi:hep_Hag family protein, partial [Escherichia coli 1-182-04_S3_C2]